LKGPKARVERTHFRLCSVVCAACHVVELDLAFKLQSLFMLLPEGDRTSSLT
jgi:hypothetical protein